MPANVIDAVMLRKMFLSGANNLEANKEAINELNVFPVPDGDTGTNMSLTIMSAVEAVEECEPTVESLSKAISSGSLRGARGNSGVILSQLFRGFTKVIRDHEELDVHVLTEGMRRAVDTAYKAVMKPKEGTILTVARGIAEKAEELASGETVPDLADYFNVLLEEGEKKLALTPELLPVLKEAGVVDSGGKGLMTFLHGAVDAYNGKAVVSVKKTEGKKAASPQSARPEIETDHIKYGYCTEFIILLEKSFGERDEQELKTFLSSIGDSLVVVADDGIVKIHVHTNDPGLAIQKALTYGQLTRMKIDNMREEHNETLFGRSGQGPDRTEKPADPKKESPVRTGWKDRAFLAVSSGDGLNEIFGELGVDRIISGGQSMNPSTEDILDAIREVHAKNIFVLPNNKNIILAANQARDLAKDCRVYVIPTKTIPQGIAAIVSYVPEESPESNVSAMEEAISDVKSGEITHAVHDATISGTKIREGDIIGIGDEGLLAVGSDLEKVILDMASKMIDEESALLSLYFGEDYPEKKFRKISDRIAEKLPDIEVEPHYGGQPVYYCILSVE